MYVLSLCCCARVCHCAELCRAVPLCRGGSPSILGALVIGLGNALFETYVSVSWTPALGWVLVILVLLLRPQGLMGRAQLDRH